MLLPHAIVVGGGLAGLTATLSLLERGANVLLLEKFSWGGNSMKATSGINAVPTRLQDRLGVHDSPGLFYNDTYASAGDLANEDLIHTLTYQSGDTIDWLESGFNITFDQLSLLGGQSEPRTHRGDGAPGATIVTSLVNRAKGLAKEQPNRLKMLTDANVTRIMKDHKTVTGVEYTHKGCGPYKAKGPVIIATGGYAADFTADSILKEYRPDLYDLPTTNSPGSEGYGHRMVRDIGGALTELKEVQVHPTALVNQSDPNAKTKFLAAEAMRGSGGILLDNKARRFANEMEKRSVVSNAMFSHNQFPYWQVLNGDAGKQLSFYTGFYSSMGLMHNASSLEETAKLMNVKASALKKQFEEYIKIAQGHQKDKFGRTSFPNHNFMQGPWYVAQVTPALHYAMGGIKIDGNSRVVCARNEHKPIPGLWAAGEAGGGVHGVNRLGGSGLLTTLVFGRQAAEGVAAYLLEELSSPAMSGHRCKSIPGHH